MKGIRIRLTFSRIQELSNFITYLVGPHESCIFFCFFFQSVVSESLVSSVLQLVARVFHDDCRVSRNLAALRGNYAGRRIRA
jgi:hypothetical protein